MTPAARIRLRLAALAAAMLLSSSAPAATRSWDAGGGAATDWTTDANWSSNIEPGVSDIAVFDRGAAFNYTVTFPFLPPFGGDITTDRLVVGSNTVTFEPDHSTTDYIASQPSTLEGDPILGLPVRGITIGADATDTAAVLVSHLSLVQTVAATLGHAPGSSGTLTLNQNNDRFEVIGNSSSDRKLIIGRYGTGVLNVSGGADVIVSGGTGVVSLGEYAGSNGTVTVEGWDSTWGCSTLFVGEGGTGTLTVTGSGFPLSFEEATLFSGAGIIAAASNSTGRLAIWTAVDK